LRQAQGAVRLGPDIEDNYATLCETDLFLGRLDETPSALKQAASRKLEGPILHWCRYQLAFLTKDEMEMERLVAAAREAGPQDLVATQGAREAQRGRPRRARELWRQAVRSAENSAAADHVAFYKSAAGMTEAYLGNGRQARLEVDVGQRRSRRTYAEVVAVYVLALAGDVNGTESLMRDLNKRWPLCSIVQRYWLPTIRARVALSMQNPEKAILQLDSMGSYELTSAGHLDPVYVRGLAYLMQGNGESAAAEFEKILEHPGLVQQNPVGALAHLGLGRAYARCRATQPGREPRTRIF